jgi:ribosome-binding factor A
MPTLRQNKVSSLIQMEIADIFQKEMKNAFGSGLITVTHVFVSPDLSFARTYLSIFGAPDKEKTLETVRKQIKEIRGSLGKRIGRQLRIVPEIAFFLDDSADYAQKIDELFVKIADSDKSDTLDEVYTNPKKRKRKK